MSQELLLTDWSKSSGTGTFEKSPNGELILSGNLVWIYTDYIALPTGTGYTYLYDFDISITANNQVYIQVERFDANKGTISNNAATNIVSGFKPTDDISHKIYKGSIDIGTFNNGTTTAFIRVRMCSGYNSTTGTHIIHNWSLRAVQNNNIQNVSIKKNGQMITDYFKEKINITNAAFNKNGFVESEHLYEY